MMVKSMNTRRKHLGTAVHDGCLYAVGGRDNVCELSSAEKYNPTINEWVNVVAMNNRRSGVFLLTTFYIAGLRYAAFTFII